MEPVLGELDVDQVLGPRDVVVVTGSDAETYLQSQLSQDVLGMEHGEQRWTLVLEPTGKIESLARVTRAGDDRYELDTDAGFGEALRARLERFRIRVDATLEAHLVSDTESSGDVERRRVMSGWPRLGAEIVPGETIPAGTGLDRIAVSFTKGCYPGQELVERMDSRGTDAPRSLRRVTVAEGAGPGDPIECDGAEVGVLTSVSGTDAIGWVKRGVGVGQAVRF